jgi:hypothetical protein
MYTRLRLWGFRHLSTLSRGRPCANPQTWRFDRIRGRLAGRKCRPGQSGARDSLSLDRHRRTHPRPAPLSISCGNCAGQTVALRNSERSLEDPEPFLLRSDPRPQNTLDPTPEQAVHCRRACGTARYAYNWGLAEWQRMGAAGEKPSMAVIKRRWNERRKAERPWTCEVTKCETGHHGSWHRLRQLLPRLGLAAAEVTCGDMVPLPAILEVRQAPWLNVNLN